MQVEKRMDTLLKLEDWMESYMRTLCFSNWKEIGQACFIATIMIIEGLYNSVTTFFEVLGTIFKYIF